MSSGNFWGSAFNTVLFGGIWVVLGAAIDKLFKAFNTSISAIPTLQDALNGMSIMQWVWSIVMVMILFVIWANYMLNENSQASGGV